MPSPSPLLEFLLTHEEQFRRARIPSLYSDFRIQRTINPDGYAANVAAWEKGLAHAAKAGVIPGGTDTLSLEFDDALRQALETREWGTPLGLEAVVDDATGRGRWIPLVHFLKSPRSIYHRSWGFDPWAVLSWGLQKLGVPGSGHGRAGGRFVVVDNVKEAGERVAGSLAEKKSRVDRVIPMQAFENEADRALGAKGRISQDDLRILLVYLARDKGLIAHDDRTVKVKAAGEAAAVVTPEDSNICSIKSLIVKLTVQVASLTAEVDALSQRARAAVAQKNRTSALSALRSKKRHEALLARRSETLAQLEGVYDKIEEAADQIEVVRAMQTGTQLLRGLNAEMGGVATVEDVLDDLREEITKVDEIGSIVADAGRQTQAIDEGEIDDELEAIEREEGARREEEAARETRRRLDALDAAINSGARDAVPAGPADEDLDRSTEALSKLDIATGPDDGGVQRESA